MFGNMGPDIYQLCSQTDGLAQKFSRTEEVESADSDEEISSAQAEEILTTYMEEPMRAPKVDDDLTRRTRRVVEKARKWEAAKKRG